MESAASVPRTEYHGPFEVLGPLTIQQIVGREVRDERSLSLDAAPAFVLKQDRGDGALRYAVALGQILGRRGLMDLLFTLAPYKAHGPDRFARVLDNWRLHDRAKTSSGSHNLLLQHVASLGLSWQVFSRHRERLIAVLEDESEARRVLPIVTWEKTAAGVRKWLLEGPDDGLLEHLHKALPILRGQSPEAGIDVNPLVGLVTIPYFLPELHRNWPAWQPLVKDGKSNYIGPASVPVMALRHRRAILNSRFIRAVEALADAGSPQPRIDGS